MTGHLSDFVKTSNNYRSVFFVCLLALVIATPLSYIGQIYIAPKILSLIQSTLFQFGGFPLLNAVFLLIGFLPVYLGLIAVLAVRDRRSIKTLLVSGRQPLLWSMIGLAVGSSLILAPIFASVIRGYGQSEVLLGTQPAASIMSGALFGILGIAFQSFAEELVFRGWAQTTIGSFCGWRIGLVITSLLFAGAHSVNASFDLFNFAGLFSFGLVMGLLVERTGAIWAAGVAHTLTNLWGLQLVAWQTPTNPSNLILISPSLRGEIFGGAQAFSSFEHLAFSCTVASLLYFSISQDRQNEPHFEQYAKSPAD